MTEILKTIDCHLENIPAGHLPELSSQAYQDAHRAFRAATSQQPMIAHALKGKMDAALPQQDGSILSIGCGSGVLDAVLAEGLEKSGRSRIAYVGVEPNPVQCETFRRSLQAFGAAVQPQVWCKTFEDFQTEGRGFDFAHIVQVLYHAKDVPGFIDKALDMVRPGGTLAVLHAPCAGLNQLAVRFWQRQWGRRPVFSEDLVPVLEKTGQDFDRRMLVAELDVTACFALPAGDGQGDGQTPAEATGKRILDFIVQYDTGKLPQPLQKSVRDYLEDIAQERDGGFYVDHPVEAFFITRPSVCARRR